jgi:hypothetical protein
MDVAQDPGWVSVFPDQSLTRIEISTWSHGEFRFTKGTVITWREAPLHCRDDLGIQEVDVEGLSCLIGLEKESRSSLIAPTPVGECGFGPRGEKIGIHGDSSGTLGHQIVQGGWQDLCGLGIDYHHDFIGLVSAGKKAMQSLLDGRKTATPTQKRSTYLSSCGASIHGKTQEKVLLPQPGQAFLRETGAVRGQQGAKALSCLFGSGAGIGCGLLDEFPLQEGFASKES